jgi:hypothetical protein
MKLALILIYAVSGLSVFIYLFCRHIRKQLREAGAVNDNLVVQKIKMFRNDDGRYFFRLILLLLSLFIFAQSVAFLVTKLDPFAKRQTPNKSLEPTRASHLGLPGNRRLFDISSPRGSALIR